MISPKLLTILLVTLFFVTVFSFSCTKNSSPTPPVHDTVTVIKNDTAYLVKNDTTYLIKNDTLYCPQADSTVDLTKGLLLYLNFTGNIADSSGNNNPTQAVGNVLTYDAHGYANNAFGADGGGEEVLVTNNGTIQFDTAYSLSYAFMVNNTNPQTYISMVDYSTGEGPSFTTGTTLPGVPNFLFGSEDVTLGCNNAGENNNIDVVDTTSLIPVPGAWYKAICIYHRGTNLVYINGQLVSSKVGLGTLSNLCASSQIIIGNWINGGQGMNGKLDNVRLYNRVLTPHEIIVLSANYQVTSNSQRPAIRTAPVHKTF